MNRNAVYPFGQAPGIKIPRSKISRPFDHKTTFNAGKLVPIYCKQVLPGQTSEIDLNSFIRLATPVTPTMDNLIADIYAFFVPNRFLWDDFEKWLGANPDGSWVNTNTYVPPKIFAASGVTTTFGVDDVGSYLGLYPGNIKIPNAGGADDADVKAYSPVALPLRAYCKIWNDWFRAEWLEKEIPYPHNGNHHILTTGSPSGTFYTDILLGRGLAPVSKTSDVFTRSLPAPQHGPAVRIPVSDIFYEPFGLFDTDGGEITASTKTYTTLDIPGLSPLTTTANVVGHNPELIGFDNTPRIGSLPIDSLGTINDLRNAFAIQRMLERDSRSGVRYTELLRSHFSVSNGDLRLGRSEYLGGKRLPINMSQVVQAGGSPDSQNETPLGSVAGLSVTGDKSSLFTKSFTEHGWLMICCCVRIAHHTYSQGIDRDKFFNTRYDLYWPELANVGEFAVYKKELYAGSSSVSNSQNRQVFGYQEAWYQYRYNPNRLSGYMATQVTGSLSVWHYGDFYNSVQSLTSSWLHEGVTEIDRTLAIPSTTTHQFIADFFVNEKVVLPMPLYSVPGLIDHI